VATHPAETAFPYLLLPSLLGARNRARRRQPGDAARAGVFGVIALAVAAAIFAVVFWLTLQLLDYEELGDYLVRIALSWLFLTFLSFLAFSAVVTALSTFFLSEDLRLLMATPVPLRRLFYSRFVKTAGQASWMIVVFMVPVLLGVGAARCAPPLYYAALPLALLPFVLIPVALGSIVTLVLVNVFPARRARDVLMLMGLLFAITLVMLIRFMQPERLLDVRSLPDVTAFFAALQSPITPLLPSFWAGEAIFSALQGRLDAFHTACLWTTALACVVLARIAYDGHYLAGFSKAQEARKARFTRLVGLEALIRRLPLSVSARSLLLKDLKVFLRDTTQWSQLLLLLALVAVYLYNFKVLDVERIPYMAGVIRNVYAFVNLALAGFVLAAVSVRFVFPSVSAEGQAFWLIRTSPVSMSAFLWSKFWTGLLPVVVLAEVLTIVSNNLLGSDPFLKWVCAGAIFFMSFGLVGMAAGFGARYPRFDAENLTQVAGSYGGIAFMVLAVLFILVEIGLVAWPSSLYLWHQYRGVPLRPGRQFLIGLCLASGVALSMVAWLWSMRRGIRALGELGR
jgi:ABC-2 type transport system permease protein